MTDQKSERKKKDRRSLYAIAGIFVIALAAWGILTFTANQNSESSRHVHVVDGEGNEYFYPLNENGTHEFTTELGTNTIEIKDVGVSMKFSDCPNQDCVHVGIIHHASEMIVCLPNQVYVGIVDNTAAETTADTTSS